LYRFNGNLVVPKSVSLEGTFRCVPSHAGIRDAGTLKPTDGSILLPYAGRGSETGAPFIQLQEDSTLKGVVIYYPEQSNSGVPTPYPFAVAMSGNNPAIIDVELLNPYQGISAVSAARHYISRIQGQPLKTGIFVDQTYDIGRIENVHWNPWFSMETQLFNWQLANGEGFIIARTDWEYVFNTFAFGYRVGYHFVHSSTGDCNGNFLGIGADNTNIAVLVEASQPYGILITNGEFTSFAGTNPTEVSVDGHSVVKFVNSAFWGPSNQIASINNTGVVGFIGCTFSAWDADNTGRAAIQVSGAGSVIIQGNEFQENKAQINLAPEVTRATIVGNLFTGTENIKYTAKSSIQIGLNAAA